MLNAVIAALLFVVVCSTVAIFLVGAWRVQQRSKRAVVEQSALPAHPQDQQAAALVSLPNDKIASVEEPKVAPLFNLPSTWYMRRRTLVSLGLLLMLLLTFFVQGGLADGGVIQHISQNLGLTFLSNAQGSNLQPMSHSLPDTSTASSRVVRIDSAARDQYQTAYQWNVWSWSSCSGIAMEMVMNAYGRHYIASDVLQEELNLGVWSVNQGLLRDDGIAMTASYFGFATDASHSLQLQAVIDIANKGQPVVVSVRDSYYFPAGHLFVIRGGDDQSVSIADSSPDNFTHMTRTMFQNMWQGFSAVLTPNS